MTTTEHAANTARAFLAAEIATASVNCGAANVTRAQAEKLLDDYFARVEQAITSSAIGRTPGGIVRLSAAMTARYGPW